MIHLKSLLAGLTGVIVIAAAFAVSLWVASRIRFGPDSPISYDGRAIIQHCWFVALPVAALGFALGFNWSRRRVSDHATQRH
jgi:hypothetical protein